MTDRSQINRAKEMILSYLSLHPNASDTIAGIRQWWLAGEGFGSGVVRRALSELVKDGRVREWMSSDGCAHYALQDEHREISSSFPNKNNGRH